MWNCDLKRSVGFGDDSEDAKYLQIEIKYVTIRLIK